MNGKFRTSISGFNRQDVLNYIQKLSEEKAALENECRKLASDLANAEDVIEGLNSEVSEKDSVISYLHAQIEKKDAYTDELNAENDNLIAELGMIRSSYNEKLGAVKLECEALENSIRKLTDSICSAMGEDNNGSL